MTDHPHRYTVSTARGGTCVQLRFRGFVAYLSPAEARLLAAQLQAAANTATAAPVIHQREATQP